MFGRTRRERSGPVEALTATLGSAAEGVSDAAGAVVERPGVGAPLAGAAGFAVIGAAVLRLARRRRARTARS